MDFFLAITLLIGIGFFIGLVIWILKELVCESGGTP